MDELRLTAPLSLWAGFDPATGRITDPRHPQHGESIAGRALHLPHARGSTSSPGVLLEAIRRGNGPAAITLELPDLTVLTAVRLAELLYGTTIPLEIMPTAAVKKPDPA